MNLVLTTYHGAIVQSKEPEAGRNPNVYPRDTKQRGTPGYHGAWIVDRWEAATGFLVLK